MTAAAQAYEFPPIRKYDKRFFHALLTPASQKDLDDNDVPFVNRDKCAAHLIAYYQCLNKGTSFCHQTKDAFYECQYMALKQRLEKR